MVKRTFVLSWLGIAFWLVLTPLSVLSQANFGTVSLSPAFEVDGEGKDVDTITFWEAPDPSQTLMFVSAKASQLVEVWKYPFTGNEQTPLRHDSFGSSTRVNGVVFDQERDLLYVSVSDPASTVSVFSYPGGAFQRQFINGAHDLKSEPNIDLYFHDNGERRAYVTADNIVYVYNAETGEELFNFKPGTSIETILADEFYRILYIPDEKSQKGVFVYNPDGTQHQRNGQDHFGGNGEFDSDEEGILLYSFPSDGSSDDGSGFIIVSDQKGNATDFEFFDRQTWAHLGTLNIDGVSNTDGIASTQRALPDYPLGLFACVNNDGSAVGVGWQEILAVTGLGKEGGGPAGAISGNVLLQDSLDPVADADVQLLASGSVVRVTKTSSQGLYHFSGLNAGQYQLQAKKSGAASSPVTVFVGEDQTVTAPPLLIPQLSDTTPPSAPRNVKVVTEGQ